MFISGFSIVFHCVCLFYTSIHCHHYYTVVVSFESWKCQFSNFVLLFKIVLTVLGALHFHMNFRITLLVSVKKSAGILMGIVLNLQISLQRVAILTILSLLIHEHVMSSLISFSTILQFSVYKLCTSLVKFILQYFLVLL